MLSTKRLEQAFPGKGRELRALLIGDKDPADYPSVKDFLIQCYNRPSTHEQKCEALNEVLEGYGVEACRLNNGHACEYINMGDTYSPTLLFDLKTLTWRLTCWGDWVEQNKRQLNYV